MTKRMQKKSAGMALVTVIIFAAVATIVITLGITLMVVQTSSSSRVASAQETLIIAESAMENALIRLLRNPNYAGETLTFPNGTATITVTGTTSKTVTVTAEVLRSKRVLVVHLTESNGVTTIDSWNEVP